MMAAMVIALLCLLAIAGWAEASLPPISCDAGGCTVVNSYREWADREPCRFTRAVFPSTEQELVEAVAQAVRTGTKLRLVSKFAHSEPKLVCPAGSSGIVISTRDYNKTIRIDASAGTVTADAGVLMQDLVDALADAGLALPHTTYWSALSIAGVISTGAHGSSLWGKGSAVHEHVTGIRIVVPASAKEGYAKVKTFSASGSPRELAAAKVSIGVLGAISQVTLQAEPLFKRSLTYDVTSDEDLEARILSLGKEQEFGDFQWYPAQHLVRYRLDNRVPMTAPGDGLNDFFAPRPEPSVEIIRTAELGLEASRNGPGKCALGVQAVQSLISTGYGFVNNKSDPQLQFKGYPVVGYNNLIQTTSRCSKFPTNTSDPSNPSPSNLICFFDLGPKGPFGFDIGVDIAVSKVPDFIRDVRKLVQKRPLGLCTLDIYSGITMRYIKGNSSAYLGKPVDSMEMDFTFFRATEAHTPRLDEDVMEEVEQMATFKYGGMPHFGKSRPLGFIGSAAKLPRLKEFLRVKKELDPKGLFSNEWTDAVLGIRGAVTKLKPFCALEGLCICSKDIHCNPDAGYFCRPGLVYKQARVCRFEGRKVGH